MGKIKQIICTALLSLGCGEIGWTIEECSPEMEAYIEYSGHAISQYEERMIREIEEKVDPALQEIPPRLVFDYLFSNEVQIKCAIPDEQRTLGAFIYNEDGNDLIMISSPHFQSIYEDNIEPNEEFLNEDGTFNFKLAEDLIRNDTNLYEGKGFNRAFEANQSITPALAELVEVIVHEATHGTWEKYRLSPKHRCENHTCEEKSERETDPFYQYDSVAREVIKSEVRLETSNALNHMAFENYVLHNHD